MTVKQKNASRPAAYLRNALRVLYGDRNDPPPEAILYRKLADDSRMDQVWRLLEKQVKKFDGERDPVWQVHFVSHVYSLTMSGQLPPLEVMTPKETRDHLRDTRKLVQALSRKLNKVGFDMFGPEELLPNRLGFLSDEDRERWRNILAINTLLSMGALLKGLEKKLADTSKASRVIAHSKGSAARARYVNVKLVDYIKSEFHLRAGDGLYATVATVIDIAMGFETNKEQVREWLRLR